MKHASFPAAEIKSATIISFPEKRKGFFARFLDALHHSRHMQARRILGQYRHLIAHNGSDPRPGQEDTQASLTD